MQTRTVLVVLGAATLLTLAGVAAYLWFLPEASTTANEAIPPEFATSTEIGRGSFAGGDAFHQTSGIVRLLSTANGTILRFENYSATGGPDVYFYLTESATPSTTEEVEGGLRLLVPGGAEGGQATVRGDFNVPLPADFDATKYRAVATWCDRFDVLFGSASFGQT